MDDLATAILGGGSTDVLDGVEKLINIDQTLTADQKHREDLESEASSLKTRQQHLEEKIAVLEVAVDKSDTDAKNVAKNIEQEKSAVSVIQQLNAALSTEGGDPDPQKLLDDIKSLQSKQQRQDQTAQISVVPNRPKVNLADVAKNKVVGQQPQDHLVSHHFADVAKTTALIHKQAELHHDKLQDISQNAAVMGATEKISSSFSIVGQEIGSLMQNIDAGKVADIAQSILHFSGLVLEGLPFGSGLGSALKEFTKCIQTARYNKEAVDVLTKRVVEFMKTLSDIRADTSDAFAGKQEEVFSPVSAVVTESIDFIKKFCQKGFLKKLMNSTSDAKKLESLDLKFKEAIEKLALLMSSKTLNLANAANEKLNVLTKMMEQLQNAAPSGGGGMAEVDPQVLADIANRAGCACADEIKSELSEVGVKLDKIQECIDALGDKLSKMESRLEDTFEKVSEVKDSLDKQNEALSILHAEQSKANEMVMRKLEALCLRSGVAGDAEIKFSDGNEAKLLAQAARDFLQATKPTFTDGNVLFHSGGFGPMKTLLDGAIGQSGGDGRDGMAGPDGEGGEDEVAEDGGNGEDGEPGDNGRPGEDGLPAHSNCVLFIAHLETKDGRRRYLMRFKIDTNFGEQEFWVDEEQPKGRIMIQLHGGNGGRGGSGGRGGAGGAGGDGGEGIENGDGGQGGTGGVGGMGSSGGNGGKGGTVFINTNDRGILMLINVDVLGGDAGAIGETGLSGDGGKGGRGGGRADYAERLQAYKEKVDEFYRELASSLEDIELVPNGGSKDHPATYTLQGLTIPDPMPLPPARPGKNGHDGKAGTRARIDPNTHDGKKGEDGKLTYCVYGELAREESAGFPYRLNFSREDSASLKPLPRLYGRMASESGETLFLFGQSLQYNKTVAPINTGQLRSPDGSTLECELTVDKKVVAHSTVTYPSVKAAKDAQPGRLLPSDEKAIQLDLPRWRTVTTLPPAQLPWPEGWASGAAVDGKLKLYFAFWKIPFAGDKNNKTTHFYNIRIESPIAFDRSIETGISAPTSLTLRDTGSVVRFRVRNRMTATKLLKRPDGDPAATSYVVRVAAAAAAPKLAVQTKGIKDVTVEAGGEWQERSYTSPVPEMEAQTTTELEYRIDLDPAAEPGTFFLTRGELNLDGCILEHTPPFRTRIAPLPPGSPSAGGDVLFVTGPNLLPGDYQRLAAISGVLGRGAHFLDWEHFAARDTGMIPGDLWTGFRGSAAVVLNFGALGTVPRPGATEAFTAELVEHNVAGGCVIVDEGASFPRPGGSKGRKERMVSVGAGGLEALEGGLEGKTPREQVAAGVVEGRGLSGLLRALIATTPAEGKLQLLARPAVEMRSLKPAQSFEQVLGKSGCFCCTSVTTKYVPKGAATAVTLRDLVLKALLDDVIQDLEEYRASGQRDRCLAIRALLAVQAQHPEVVCALLDASGALSTKTRMGQYDKEWKEWALELRAAASPGGSEGCELGQRIAGVSGELSAESSATVTASDLVFAGP